MLESSGGGAGGGPDTGSKRTVYYRADVLRFFPLDTAINGQVHRVRLPDSGVGKRDPVHPGRQLGHRVPGSGARLCGPIQGDFHILDGGFTISQSSDKLTQPIKGFYQASLANPNARLLTIVGDGQGNFSEAVQFTDNLKPLVNGQPQHTMLATNPYVDGWDTKSFDLPMSKNAESAQITVLPVSSNFDCLTGGVFILSTGPRMGTATGSWTSGKPPAA